MSLQKPSQYSWRIWTIFEHREFKKENQHMIKMIPINIMKHSHTNCSSYVISLAYSSQRTEKPALNGQFFLQDKKNQITVWALCTRRSSNHFFYAANSGINFSIGFFTAIMHARLLLKPFVLMFSLALLTTLGEAQRWDPWGKQRGAKKGRVSPTAQRLCLGRCCDAYDCSIQSRKVQCGAVCKVRRRFPPNKHPRSQHG